LDVEGIAYRKVVEVRHLTNRKSIGRFTRKTALEGSQLANSQSADPKLVTY